VKQATLLKLLEERRRGGEALLRRAEGLAPDRIDDLRQEVLAWDKSVKHLAAQASMEDMLSELSFAPIVLYPSTPEDWKSALINGLKSRLAELDHIINLARELLRVDETEGNFGPKTPLNPTRVFLVHGQDEGAREKVARFLEKVGLEVVILHEQPNVGKTLIEKLEDNTDVGYAVVLLTADDEGRAQGDEELRPRARQNVVFEAGYLMGRLGRDRVALLYNPDVELPSDMHGLVYIPLDETGAWEKALFKELRMSGMSVSSDRWP